jgi:hypothetical protein
MALRAVLEHPKFSHLKTILGETRAHCLGYLEAIWHFTGRFTPQGNIGKYEDGQIEAWVEWQGTPGSLINALVQSHWIDRDASHRLVVHDWHIHADAATKLALKRSKSYFVATVSRQCRNGVSTVFGTTSELIELPVPEPVPEPVPVVATKCRDNCDAPATPEEWAEKLYLRHPKKKDQVLVQQEVARIWNSSPDPQALFSGTIDPVHRRFCRSKEWQEKNGQFAPQLARWLNDRAYIVSVQEEDPDEGRLPKFQ